MRVRYSFSSRHTGFIDAHNKHSKPIPKMVREIVDISEIVLIILDARFVEDTRDKRIEAYVKEKKKKIIYVINKIDLLDESARIKLKEKLANLYPYVLVSAKARRGIRELRDRIKIEATRLETEFKTTHVGVIGYPNTGKSSLINILSGRSSAPTSQQAGYTKGIQKIRLRKGLVLLDSPGLIAENENSAIDKNALVKHAKISVRTYDKVKDPEFVVMRIMKECPGRFEKFYNIQANGDVEILIEELGRKKHIIKKGNLVDNDRVARLILKDWQEGIIKS